MVRFGKAREFHRFRRLEITDRDADVFRGRVTPAERERRRDIFDAFRFVERCEAIRGRSARGTVDRHVSLDALTGGYLYGDRRGTLPILILAIVNAGLNQPS